MSPTTDAWNDLNNAVLEVFGDSALTVSEVCRAVSGVPDTYVRAALRQNADQGFLTPTRGAVHTTYRITDAGRRHLTNVMEVA